MALLYPILTEKSFDMVEKQNKIVFAVDKNATKAEIKKEVEEKYNVKVKKINIVNEFARGKKAFITLMPEFEAGKIISDLGLI